MQIQGVKDMMFGSPYWSLVEAITNNDFHSNRPIFDKNDPDTIAREKIGTFLKRRWFPSAAPGGYFYERAKNTANETPDYLGQVKTRTDFATEVAMGYRGVTVDWKSELDRIKREDDKQKSYLTQQIKYKRRDAESKRITQKEADRLISEYEKELDGLKRKKYPPVPLSGNRAPALTPQSMGDLSKRAFK
jgi:hypothetical protein